MIKPVADKKDAIKRLRAAHFKLVALGVANIGIFGSFAKDKQSDLSDIDILVEFSPESHSFDNFMNLTFMLKKIMGREVEVVTKDSLSPFIGPHILQEVEHVSFVA